MWWHIDVQADWRRSWTYGRSPNAIDISQGSLTCPSEQRQGTNLSTVISRNRPISVAFYDAHGDTKGHLLVLHPQSPQSFLKQEAQRATYRAPEYNVPPFWQIGQGGHLFFPIGTKNKNLVEDIEILLPVKFRWIPFSGFRGEIENVSANQRPGRPSCFSDRPEKHKLGRGRWDLASCQVSFNSVQRFQRRSRKCLSQSEARAAILFFRSARKTQTW